MDLVGAAPDRIWLLRPCAGRRRLLGPWRGGAPCHDRHLGPLL